MTIDERLARLAEHQTVELLTPDVQTLAKNAVTLHDSIKSLEHIAEIHERPIERLEGD